MRNQSAQYLLWLSVSVEEYVAFLFSLSLAFNVDNSLGQKAGHVEKKNASSVPSLSFHPWCQTVVFVKRPKDYGLSACVPPKIRCGNLITSVTVLGGGVIGR